MTNCTLNLNIKKIYRRWYILNAKNFVLGRLASIIVYYLIGKSKVEYSTNFDVGDYVIVYNINKVCVTGRKYFFKPYYFHSGYPGGLKKIYYKKFHLMFPEKVFFKTIKGMLPKNKLRKSWLNKLFLYKDLFNPHMAQNPIFLEV